MEIQRPTIIKFLCSSVGFIFAFPTIQSSFYYNSVLGAMQNLLFIRMKLPSYRHVLKSPTSDFDIVSWEPCTRFESLLTFFVKLLIKILIPSQFPLRSQTFFLQHHNMNHIKSNDIVHASLHHQKLVCMFFCYYRYKKKEK